MRVGNLDNYTEKKGDDKKIYYFMAVFGAIGLGFILMIGSRVLGGLFKILWRYWYVVILTLLVIFFLRRKKRK